MFCLASTLQLKRASNRCRFTTNHKLTFPFLFLFYFYFFFVHYLLSLRICSPPSLSYLHLDCKSRSKRDLILARGNSFVHLCSRQCSLDYILRPLPFVINHSYHCWVVVATKERSRLKPTEPNPEQKMPRGHPSYLFHYGSCWQAAPAEQTSSLNSCEWLKNSSSAVMFETTTVSAVWLRQRHNRHTNHDTPTICLTLDIHMHIVYILHIDHPR